MRSPSLYWHVRDKAALLDLVAEAICADAFDIDAALPWRGQLESGLRQFPRDAARPPGCRRALAVAPPAGPHRRRHIDTTIRILRGAGFPETDAAGIARAGQ